MTILQKLQLRQSEVREKLNTLLGLETRTEEQDAELVTLTAEGQKIEPELRGRVDCRARSGSHDNHRRLRDTRTGRAAEPRPA